MSKVAIFQRVQKSAAFLEWLAVHICRVYNYLAQKPEWLEAYRVLLVDATKTSRSGSCQADDTLHCLTELFSLSIAEWCLTPASTGETLKNFSSLRNHDLVIGDRAYGTISSMRWAEEHEAFYVFRLKAGAFCLYTRSETGEYERFDLEEQLETWEEGKTLDLTLFYKHGGGYNPIRVCARGKTYEQVQAGLKRIQKSNHGRKISHLQEVYNRYIVVVSNLPDEVSAEQILELFRMRWQIELVFKRLKTIIKYDEIKTKSDTTTRAWLHCKLIMAAICEIYVQKGAVFSPSGEKPGGQNAEIIMAGIECCLRGTDDPFA